MWCRGDDDSNGKSKTDAIFSCLSVAETSTHEIKHHIQRVGELKFITLEGPEELTLQALSPEQSFYAWIGMIKQVAGAG